MIKGNDHLTIAQAARVLGVSTTTIRRWIDKGGLAAYRVGPRKLSIRRADLEMVVRPARDEAGVMTYDDPLWRLVGAATDAPPTDAAKKHEYLADSMTPTDN